MKLLFHFNLLLLGLRSLLALELLNNDWENLNNHVTFKLFTSPPNDQTGDFNQMWAEGTDIRCTAYGEDAVRVQVLSRLNPYLPVKLLTHGFTDTVINDKLAFVPA